MFSRVVENMFCYNLDNGDILKEVIVKIRLERINTQESVIVEALLDSSIIRLVICLEFTRKQGFKLKKIERLIYVKNIDSFFNKEKSIKYTVKVNIYYQGYKKRMDIDVISSQKWSVIQGMP